MKNETDILYKQKLNIQPSPSFARTAREWILASALYDGIEDEDIRQIEVLLSERGANPNVLLPEYGITPFHLVVANESSGFAVHATDVCLQHGADPNVRSEDGLTPVHLAAMWGCGDVLRVLLAAGGNPWLVDCFNKNAFDYAQIERQDECFNILNANCNSQPVPSSHSKSPYQLNLKRVILYKNDLEIVYEASPTKSKKCTSTQTDSSTKCSPVDNFGKISSASEINNQKNTQRHGNNGSSGQRTKAKRISTLNINGNCKNSEEKISCALKEAILNHRRNSTVFEYTPSKEGDKSSSSGVISWKKWSDSSSGSSVAVTELIDKLEETNKIRQTFKSKGSESDFFKYVTQRKKTPKRSDQTLKLESSSNYESCNSEQFYSRTGCNVDDAKISKDVQSDSCFSEQFHSKIGWNVDDTTMSKDGKSVVINSPPSIGSILENLDQFQMKSRGSSLFSDIASDVEVCTPVRQNVQNIGDIMTDDEDRSRKRESAMYSSTDSLYPNVSLDKGTRSEVNSSELYESCLDRSPETASGREVHSLLESILGTMESDSATPVNKKLITSTPERTSSGSDETHFSSAESERRGWVEAKVSSSSEEEYISVSEEYEYTDEAEGVVLIEKRHLINELPISTRTNHKKVQEFNAPPSSGSEESEVSSLTRSERAYDTDELRQALKEHGLIPGPINGSTKRVYLRRLKRFLRKPPLPTTLGTHPAYSAELVRTLDAACEHLLHEWAHLEDSMAASFACSQRTWRQGQTKTSFTYLLLDPRLTPVCSPGTLHAQLWPQFLRAVFYVGKGKRARPYSHLYHATKLWNNQRTDGSQKIKRILDIWTSGQGVVCLHVFQNIIPVEALTREAAMIAAFTLPRLTNEKAGEFYGSAASWGARLQRRLGCVLLHRAYRVFLAEGERQLRPADID